jgi:hypothetical protein
LHFDASIYRANPNDSEKYLDPEKVSIFVITFDNLTQKKVKNVGDFANMAKARPGDWPAVRLHVAPAIEKAGGKHCRAKRSKENLLDFRLQVSTPHARTVITDLVTALAKHKIKLRRTARL